MSPTHRIIGTFRGEKFEQDFTAEDTAQRGLEDLLCADPEADLEIKPVTTEDARGAA